MLRLRRVLLMAACMGMMGCGIAAAQNGRPQGASPRQRVNGRFDQNSPNIGELLPDVSVYDADGKPLKLRSLKGNYTVLVSAV